MASSSKVELLEARVAELECELSRLKGVGRGKISQMSDEVVDSNPYRWSFCFTVYSHRACCGVSRIFYCLTGGCSPSPSRLMALKRMGIVDNYEASYS